MRRAPPAYWMLADCNCSTPQPLVGVFCKAQLLQILINISSACDSALCSRDQTLHSFLPRSLQSSLPPMGDTATAGDAVVLEDQAGLAQPSERQMLQARPAAMPSRKRRSSGQGDLREEWRAEEEGRAQGVAATTGAALKPNLSSCGPQTACSTVLQLLYRLNFRFQSE